MVFLELRRRGWWLRRYGFEKDVVEVGKRKMVKGIEERVEIEFEEMPIFMGFRRVEGWKDGRGPEGLFLI